MGVPKFFRWMSERYPCLSEVVKEYQIPDFDNLYLDMNGIIHPCSHPDDSNPHFRITEETIFNNIFHYIEFIFRMIRPKKVFFMAVDGVAPRAKMNQQRGRRFRSVREAQDREREARNRGEVLPTEKRFDSNCITPGTGFMVRLNAQLQYFVARKISTDPLWQGIRVILSGHDVPGEGEHKVMEFIRYEKSLPDYDHNTRHCLYGLDADLIVLGLCTHEPHFCLLREEVLFTKQQSKRTTVPEEMTFYLLHLCLFREYLEYEFGELKRTLPFAFDLERVIDDWVVLGFLVGNDFVPHLPNLHIREDALPTLYRCYKEVLPTLDGYINDGGTLVLKRFEALMKWLAQWELDKLEDKAADQRWLKGKRQQGTVDIRVRGNDGRKSKSKLKGRDDFESFSMLDMMGSLDEFVEEELEPNKNKSVFGEIHTNIDDELLEGDESVAELEYRQQRRHYYKTKMDIDITPQAALEQAVEYVRAIQWILHYYFDGVCSWSWYYPSHYAPYIGDVQGFCDVPSAVAFDYGRPFLPYEQLLGVLPAASRDSLPECLRPLMTSPQSPIIEYYPEDFQTDLNGKQQDWEAVVLIPFIDQERLLAAIRPLYAQLEPEEAARNVHGDACQVEYTADDQGRTESPGYFAPLARTFAKVSPRPRDAFIADRSALRKGLLPDLRLDMLFAGFPTLRHVPHNFHLARQKVKVFQQSSNGESMILTVKDPWEGAEPDAAAEARRLLGRSVFVQWPHLTEATVVSVVSIEKRYRLQADSGQLTEEELTEADRTVWIGHMHDIKSQYESRLGILTDDIPLLVYARPLAGRKYVATSDGKVKLEKQWSSTPKPYALQTCVRELRTLDATFTHYHSISDLFSEGSHCFVLAADSYGAMGKVIGVTEKARVRLDVTLAPEPDFTAVERKQARLTSGYFPGYVVAQKLGITSHLVSRLTGCIFLTPGGGRRPADGASNIVRELEDARIDRDAKFNCAIEIKHNKKNEEMPGWSRRCDNQWMYSGRLIDTLREYMTKFPELIEFLGLHTEGFKFHEGDVWPDTETRARRVQQLKDWLRQLPCSHADRWPCGAPLLEAEVVRAVEQAVDAHRPPQAHTRLSVKPHLLYKPSQIGGSAPADPQAAYQLYDRVINVRQGFCVPLGAKGTVIGIREAPEPADVLYDVLFDAPFEGGLPLRCSPGRGYKMPPFSLVNISYGLRLKSGQASQPPAAALGVGRAANGVSGGGGQKQFSHSPGSPFAETHRTSAAQNSGAARNSPQQTRNSPRQARNAAQQARNSPQPVLNSPQQAQHGPAVVAANASKAGSAVGGGGSPHHQKVAGSGRLAHLRPMPPPPLFAGPPAPRPAAGDTFSDIWQDLQRAAAPAAAPAAVSQVPAVGHVAPARQVVPVQASPVGSVAAVGGAPPPPPPPPPPAAANQVQPSARPERPLDSCDRLLRLLQHTDGGVPRYTYTAAVGGLFVATVVLPMGQSCQGGAAPSRDQAAALAAAAALAQMGAAPGAGPPPTGRTTVPRSQDQDADFLSLLRSPVRATLPPPARPPPSGDITDSLLQMLAAAGRGGQLHSAPPAPAPAQSRGRPGQSTRTAPAPTQNRGQPGPRAAPAQGRSQPGQSARAAQNGGRAPAGRQGAFVPMQVTKKTTPKKGEAAPGGRQPQSHPAAGSTTTEPPVADGVTAASEAGTAAEAATGATAEAAAGEANGGQQGRQRGTGRLFRRGPRRNRLACKF